MKCVLFAGILAVCTLTAVPVGAQSHDAATASPSFRMVRERIPGGGELLTVFGRPDAALGNQGDGADEIPLVSVLRDTLGDSDRTNDRLRYVWVHGYTSPSAEQRMASAIPFLNRRTGNKAVPEKALLPPSLIDLGAPERELWKTAAWVTAQYALFNPYGVLVKTSVQAFRRNDNDYKTAHIVRALSILDVYEEEADGPSIMTSEELRDVQGRLVLAQRMLGGVIENGYLQRVRELHIAATLDVRGHNWELLRQRVEAERLYFDPLTMPDGSATHVLVWVARQDVDSGRRFNSRFLNIKSPWGDKRLREWTGFTETRTVDSNGALVPPETPGAREVQLIPLAVYGLDHPKIPAVLIDFRDHNNPKRREITRRMFNDITRNVLGLSPYGDLEYFAGRSVYNFVTGRRGMDINQPSRLRSYSQLKLLLSLNEEIDPELAKEASRLIERVSMNPLQNDLEVERALAEQSYAALVEALESPDGGLQHVLRRAREQEYTKLRHGPTARAFMHAATIASLGAYRHKEEQPADQQDHELDAARRLAYHERYLKQLLASTPVVEVTANMDDVRQSLRYLMEHAAVSDESISKLASRLFVQTRDVGIRELTLDCLARMDTPSAHRALLEISRDARETEAWRAAARQHLFLPEPADLAESGPAGLTPAERQ
jgi:hypothetical protein